MAVAASPDEDALTATELVAGDARSQDLPPVAPLFSFDFRGETRRVVHVAGPRAVREGDVRRRDMRSWSRARRSSPLTKSSWRDSRRSGAPSSKRSSCRPPRRRLARGAVRSPVGLGSQMSPHGGSLSQGGRARADKATTSRRVQLRRFCCARPSRRRSSPFDRLVPAARGEVAEAKKCSRPSSPTRARPASLKTALCPARRSRSRTGDYDARPSRYASWLAIARRGLAANDRGESGIPRRSARAPGDRGVPGRDTRAWHRRDDCRRLARSWAAEILRWSARVLLGKDLANRGFYSDAAERLDRALAKRLSVGRVLRRRFRQRVIVACALGDAPTRERLTTSGPIAR